MAVMMIFSSYPMHSEQHREDSCKPRGAVAALLWLLDRLEIAHRVRCSAALKAAQSAVERSASNPDLFEVCGAAHPTDSPNEPPTPLRIHERVKTLTQGRLVTAACGVWRLHSAR